jgi:hypothetical protein
MVKVQKGNKKSKRKLFYAGCRKKHAKLSSGCQDFDE